MIKKGNVRFEISMEKEAYDLISKFSNAYHMRKSEFIVCCCLNHIQNICTAIEKSKQNKKQKGEK
ncbi:MAG: hypothetical protein J6S67_16640 [Methanobrevibacter sp.]|nr:hypothetical protein [Methanobrevibacter sp.]